VKDHGGSKESEEAVERGLKWLRRQQMSDGRWMLNSPDLPVKDRGSENNDSAATALALLPFLAAGHTHKNFNANNPYDKNIDKGLKFLIRTQDKKGYFGKSMYGHGLATIAMCEAYGMTQDPALKQSAQKALDLLVSSQHQEGGWRYTPEKQAGDLSVSGWQIMALKTGQAAGLDVPADAVARARKFLDLTNNKQDKGYGYTAGSPSSYRTTAIGLLCRQHLEAWGPNHPKFADPLKTFIKANPPDRAEVYYSYYATQVMFLAGGKDWEEWNDKMRDYLVKKQDTIKDPSPNFGSWSPEGDQWGRAGGRLMITTMNLLTLEVYYRYARRD
jgi:Squalene-hopene cyclase C-terminal domain